MNRNLFKLLAVILAIASALGCAADDDPFRANPISQFDPPNEVLHHPDDIAGARRAFAEYWAGTASLDAYGINDPRNTFGAYDTLTGLVWARHGGCIRSPSEFGYRRAISTLIFVYGDPANSRRPDEDMILHPDRYFLQNLASAQPLNPGAESVELFDSSVRVSYVASHKSTGSPAIVLEADSTLRYWDCQFFQSSTLSIAIVPGRPESDIILIRISNRGFSAANLTDTIEHFYYAIDLNLGLSLGVDPLHQRRPPSNR